MDSDYMLIIAVVVGFILILTYFTFSSTADHEKAHKQIAYHFGCINGTITYRLNDPSSFQCHEYINRTVEQRNYEYILHETNEIVSYNLSSFGNSIIMCFTLLSLVIVFVYKRVI